MVKREGAWRTWTWKEYSEDVHRAARAMIHLGLGERDCINVIGFNSPGISPLVTSRMAHC